MVIRHVSFTLMLISCLCLLGADDPQVGDRAPHVQVRTLDSIILFEKGDAKNAYTVPSAVFMSLYEAIKTQAAPIFTGGAVLHALYEAKRAYQQQEQTAGAAGRIDTVKQHLQDIADVRKRLNEVEQERKQLAETDYDGKADKLEESFQLWQNVDDLRQKLFSEWELIQQYCASQVFDFQQWDVYKHPNFDAYVLIPHAYEEQVDRTWNLIAPQKRERVDQLMQEYAISERELKLGLRVDHPDIMQKINTQDQLYQALNNTWGTMRAKLMSSYVARGRDLYTPFTSFFVSHDENDVLFGRWNIYLEGHGYPPLKRTSVLEKMVSGSVKPLIAGMTYTQFQQFLRFLHTNVQTNFLYWTTCYGGGKNLDFAKNMLLHLNGEQQAHELAEDALEDISARAFVAASGSITDASVPISTYEEGFLQKCIEGTPAIQFREFFDALNTYAHARVQYKEQMIQRGRAYALQYPQFLQSLLWPHIKEALRIITPMREGGVGREWIYAAPMVYVPGKKRFEVAEIHDGFISIDRSYMWRHYGEPIIVDDRQALLLREHLITNPMVIRTTHEDALPWFISLTPGNAMHTLNQVTIDTIDSMHKFLYDSFFTTETAYDKVFHIMHLNGRDLLSTVAYDIQMDNLEQYSIENVMIHVARERMLYASSQGKHRVLFTLRHASGDRRFIKGSYGKTELTMKEITAKQAQKEGQAMIRRIGGDYSNPYAES